MLLRNEAMGHISPSARQLLPNNFAGFSGIPEILNIDSHTWAAIGRGVCAHNHMNESSLADCSKRDVFSASFKIASSITII